MTYTFYCPSEGRHIIYDTESGAVIRSTEIEAYICDALYPCGEDIAPLPAKSEPGNVSTHNSRTCPG